MKSALEEIKRAREENNQVLENPPKADNQGKVHSLLYSGTYIVSVSLFRVS